MAFLSIGLFVPAGTLTATNEDHTMTGNSFKERLKTRKLWGGVTLAAFGIAGLSGVDPWMAISLLAIVWGVMGIFWQHNWQHKRHGHHHHSKPKEDD